MSTAQTSSGHCQCGAVSYTVNGKLRPIMYCHCEQCRRTGGHFVAATACHPDQIDISGAENIKWYRSSPAAERGFCMNCGSNLFWKPEHGGHWGVWAGSLNRPTGLKAVQHIYVHMKSDYYDLDDGLPQYEEEYPSFEFEESK
ncbi:MAG: GFA family protein [Woeseiaceae bacterium]